MALQKIFYNLFSVLSLIIESDEYSEDSHLGFQFFLFSFRKKIHFTLSSFPLLKGRQTPLSNSKTVKVVPIVKF